MKYLSDFMLYGVGRIIVNYINGIVNVFNDFLVWNLKIV